ncbi:MAG: FecR domain-containing protein [Burkholderiales bacterium]
MWKFWMCALAALCVMPVTPAAARVLTVEGVVSPAWVERGGKREPLTVGMQLSDKDKLITGERARVMLRMAEGSAVKMGENATLALDNLTEKKSADNTQVVGASLDVVKGAFRFTTGIFGKARAERNVNVKISTITAGIRGTDVWGRSNNEQDVVCLLEGRISVRHEKQEFVMDEPLQFFIAPRNEKPKPVGKVPQKQIDEWSEETEIREGQGATRAGGKLRVELARFADQNAARELETRLKAAGYPAVIDPITGGQYAVCVLGIATAKDRDMLASRLKAVMGGAPAPVPSAPAAPKAY